MRCVMGALALLLVTGCSTLDVRKDAVAGVKTAAIAGYGAQYELTPKGATAGSKQGLFDTVNAVRDLKKAADGDTGAERVAQAEHAVDHLGKALHELVGWQVKARDDVAANADYSTWRDEERSSLANASQALGGMTMVPGVALAWAARDLKTSERDALMTALEVDALIVVDVLYRIGDSSGMTIGGIGKKTYFPEAVVKMTVYAKGDKEPIWDDRWAEGSPAGDGFDQTVGVKTDDRLDSAIRQASENGVKALVKRYREAD